MFPVPPLLKEKEKKLKKEGKVEWRGRRWEEEEGKRRKEAEEEKAEGREKKITSP